jgi:hypothetical protein
MTLSAHFDADSASFVTNKVILFRKVEKSLVFSQITSLISASVQPASRSPNQQCALTPVQPFAAGSVGLPRRVASGNGGPTCRIRQHTAYTAGCPSQSRNSSTYGVHRGLSEPKPEFVNMRRTPQLDRAHAEFVNMRRAPQLDRAHAEFVNMRRAPPRCRCLKIAACICSGAAL